MVFSRQRSLSDYIVHIIIKEKYKNIKCVLSMLHVLDGSWKPNEEDKKNKLEPGITHNKKPLKKIVLP
jgi:hypothetical protein